MGENNVENPIKMDDLGGKPTIFGNIHNMGSMAIFECSPCGTIYQKKHQYPVNRRLISKCLSYRFSADMGTGKVQRPDPEAQRSKL